MSGERGPGRADLVLHLSGFLIHECDHLPQVFDFCSWKKYFDMHPVHLDVFQYVCFLVGENSIWMSFNMFVVWLERIFVLGEFRHLALLYIF